MNLPSIPEVVGMSLLTTFLFVLAWRRGFFQTPPRETSWDSALGLRHVSWAFAMYLGTFFIALFLLAPKLLQEFSGSNIEKQVKTAATIHLLIYSLVLFALACFVHMRHLSLWKDPKEARHLYKDLCQAACCWLLAYPLVLSLQAICQLLLFYLFHITELPDQIAVYILKMALSDPFALLATLMTIVVLAPITEELLFRGFLQIYLRQYIGPSYAIACTALIFSLFHFSFIQGLSNIPIVISLFTLALFLGWLYEKQRSLIAPIALHILFNGVNALQLYLGIPPSL